MANQLKMATVDSPSVSRRSKRSAVPRRDPTVVHRMGVPLVYRYLYLLAPPDAPRHPSGTPSLGTNIWVPHTRRPQDWERHLMIRAGFRQSEREILDLTA
jgi:hypothetical protein